jgi:hypothetical protein
MLAFSNPLPTPSLDENGFDALRGLYALITGVKNGQKYKEIANKLDTIPGFERSKGGWSRGWDMLNKLSDGSKESETQLVIAVRGMLETMWFDKFSQENPALASQVRSLDKTDLQILKALVMMVYSAGKDPQAILAEAEILPTVKGNRLVETLNSLNDKMNSNIDVTAAQVRESLNPFFWEILKNATFNTAGLSKEEQGPVAAYMFKQFYKLVIEPNTNNALEHLALPAVDNVAKFLKAG